jgi:hypothetical protein
MNANALVGFFGRGKMLGTIRVHAAACSVVGKMQAFRLFEIDAEQVTEWELVYCKCCKEN